MIGGQKTLDPMLLDAVGIEQKNRRRPRRLVTFAVLLECRRIVLHVYAGGNKILIDKAHDALVGPHLGVQPSTATSHRRGAEIEQHGLPLRLGVLEDSIHIVAEIDFHVSFLLYRYTPR